MPLEGYSFRKSVRKILNRVDSQFQTVVRAAEINPEKEELYQRYRQHFKGKLAPTLKNSLQDDLEFNIFHSMEVAVYEGSKLIAFSVFDLGKDSLASIKGVYDPQYGGYSLGIYTMLREIRYGLENGFRFYYPGYIVPGYDRFDYKLRIGKREELEFFNLKTRQWHSFGIFSKEHILVDVLTDKLTSLGWGLSGHHISCQMLYYPAYEAHIFGYENDRFLEAPLFLNIFNNIFPRPRFIVFYDIWKEKYVFCHCMPFEDLGFYFEYSMQFDTHDARHFLDFILKKSKIVETDSLQTVVKIAADISKLLKSERRNNGL